MVLAGPAELIRWLIERYAKKNKEMPPEPNPKPPTPNDPDARRHDLLRRIADRHRTGAAALAIEHTTERRVEGQRALAAALTPLLDEAMAFPADRRFQHPEHDVRNQVRAAVQLRAAVRALSREGDRGAEAEARRSAGLGSGQWCGAFAFAHASDAGLDSDFSPDALSTGPNQGLDNLFTYRDSHRWAWTGEEWIATKAFHTTRGSLRSFTLIPEHPDPASIDIQPGDIVLKDNAKGTFADHITTCASYDPATGLLTTVGGNEGRGTKNASGVGVSTFDVSKNGAPQTVAPGQKKVTRIYAVGRWSLVDFEDHQFSASTSKPTQPPKGVKPVPRPKPNPNPGPSLQPPHPKPNPGPAMEFDPGDHAWEYKGLISQANSIPRKEWFEGSEHETDYKGHGSEISHYVIYPDHLKRGRPHMRGHPGTFAWLNNNPGNLTAGGSNVGEYPGKRSWHNFLIFPSPEVGFDAIPKFLKANRYGPMSILDAFKRYAPKGDGINKPDHYAQSVVDAIGGSVTLQTKIDDLDSAQMLEVQKAIRKMEGVVAGDTLARDDAQVPPAIKTRL